MAASACTSGLHRRRARRHADRRQPGPDTRELARETGLSIIASGGVASLDDIAALVAHRNEGIDGVIVGMALYRGAIDLRQALQVAQGEGECWLNESYPVWT